MISRMSTVAAARTHDPVATDAAPEEVSEGRFERADWLVAILVMVVSTVIAAWVLQLWHADRLVPLYYGGDALFTQGMIKGLLDHGWYLQNSNLGAPDGLQLQDFAGFSGDTIPWVVIRILGVFFSNSAEVMNGFFLLTFPSAALSTFVVLRVFGVTRWTGAVVAVLYATAPFHFLRNE